ncbi:DUF2922 domain-containing protein [Bacillus sp. 2205SS5-2]|uniref:DUF2922 domain-containing protein n=1 Tax=Bacillus sp. 2205SS5-2 TaxID=3109031 RepID=UPI003004A695
MAKSLELQFVTDEGKTARLTLDDPNEPVNETEVKQAMEIMIANNVFQSTSGQFVAVKGARLLERNVTDITIE